MVRKTYIAVQHDWGLIGYINCAPGGVLVARQKLCGRITGEKCKEGGSKCSVHITFWSQTAMLKIWEHFESSVCYGWYCL